MAMRTTRNRFARTPSLDIRSRVARPTMSTPQLTSSGYSRPTSRGPSMSRQCPPGQHLRGGKLLIAIGGPAPTVVAAATTVVITYAIPESGRAMRFVTQETTAGTLFPFTLDDIQHNNVSLTSGICPMEQFSPDAQPGSNPIVGRWLQTNDALNVTVTNHSAGALNLVSSFSIA